MKNDLSVLILEDDFMVARHIRSVVEKGGYGVAGIAANRAGAMELAMTSNIGLILADIGLANNECGIDVVNNIRMVKPTPVIFLTAYASQSIIEKMMLAMPSAYLNKPFREEELLTNIDIAMKNAHRQSIAANPMSETVKDALSDYVFIPLGKGYKRLAKQDILFIEANGSYVQMQTHCGPLTISTNIGNIERQLNDSIFIRISRKHLVNILVLEGIENNCAVVRGRCFPIGDVYRQSVMSRLQMIRTK